jgi:hypothetical protein
MNGLAAGAILGLSVVLGSGKGGTWALPAFLAFEAIVLTIGLVFGIRAHRAQSRDR